MIMHVVPESAEVSSYGLGNISRVAVQCIWRRAGAMIMPESAEISSCGFRNISRAACAKYMAARG